MIAGSMGNGPVRVGSIGISLAGLNGVPCSLGTSGSDVAAVGNGRLRMVASVSRSRAMSCASKKGGLLAVDVVHSERQPSVTHARD